MTYQLQSAKKIKRDSVTQGIKLVYENTVDPNDIQVKEYGIGDMSYVDFKKMVIGQGGSVQNPGGEALAWLNHLNVVITIEDI